MKALITLILAIGIGIFAYFYKLPSVCSKPIPYKIGSIDQRFNLTKQDLATDIQEAASAWSKNMHNSLFEYAPEDQDALTISMVYDERQLYTSEITESEAQLKNEKQETEPKIADYNRRVEEFKKEVDDLNAQIRMWNEKGGAPEEEYRKIVAKQEELKQKAAALRDEGAALNQTTNQYNTQVGQLNKTVDTFNSLLQYKPEEGLYSSKDNTIKIYFNTSRDELIHTLEHELGHALGLEHIMDPNSIMFPRTNDVMTPSSNDLNQLAKICEQHTLYETLQKRLTEIRTSASQ